MNGTALKHRGSATVWRHQGDWLQHSSDDPSCTSGRRHKQAVPPHSRHMSCSVDPPSATGTQLDHETADSSHHDAPCSAHIYRDVTFFAGDGCRPARCQLRSRRRTPAHGTSRSGTVAGSGSERRTGPLKSLQRIIEQLFPPSPSDCKSAPQHADARCYLCWLSHIARLDQAHSRENERTPDRSQECKPGPALSTDAVSSTRCAVCKPP